MKVSNEARRIARQLIRVTLKEGSLNEDTARKIVAGLIAAKPRYYTEILSAFQRLLRLEVEKRHAVVESAAEIGEEERGSITSRLKNEHGQDITTEYKVNPSLIGGLRVKLGSTVWDGSVKARLDNLRDAFLS